MREGQGGSWLRALVISGVSTAARALQMALTDWTTLSAFSGKSPCGREVFELCATPNPVLERGCAELVTRRRNSRNHTLFSGIQPQQTVAP